MAMGNGAAHTMAGLPPAALWTAIVAALALTIWSVARGRTWFVSAAPGSRFNLLSLSPLRAIVSKRPFQFALQIPLVLTLFLILTAGFAGTPVAERNFATVATWTIWWTLLIADIVLLGRMWCLVCPWDAIASWISRLAFWRRRDDEPLALGLPWPRWLRNVYPATILFLGLTWLELGFGVTKSPRATAILGLLMVLLAVIPALVFEKKSFCKYGCLIGRICGLYSMLAPVEVRAADLDVCRTCRTKDCLNGNASGYACPTGQSLASMKSNTYCTVCTECVKSCPNQNVAINLRAWSSDLHDLPRPRRDEATLALVMLAMTSFHGLTMTPVWESALERLGTLTGLSRIVAFSIGMTLVLVLPVAIYLAFTAIAARWASNGVSRGRTFATAASRYAYPLIAVALMYHLAHNAGHFITEAETFVPVISDPLGQGLNLMGTAGFAVRPLASQNVIWTMQIALVLIGLFWALRTTERAHRWLAKEWNVPAIALRSRLVTAAFLLLITLANLWLLAQPMEMRTGM